jgi:hypothetical protein
MNSPSPSARRRTVVALGLLVASAALVLPGCGPRPAVTSRKVSEDFLTQKARESGGDFNRLSPEDQKRVQSMTQGHGVQAIRGRAGR